jgi:hypothetical protein
LEKVPTEQHFSADDQEVIALAEILVKSDIAAVEDLEKSGRDATKYLLLTLQRWIRNHASRLIDLMPGNDDGVIAHKEQL